MDAVLFRRPGFLVIFHVFFCILRALYLAIEPLGPLLATGEVEVPFIECAWFTVHERMTTHMRAICASNPQLAMGFRVTLAVIGGAKRYGMLRNYEIFTRP